MDALVLARRFLSECVCDVAPRFAEECGEAERVFLIARLAVETEEAALRVSAIVEIAEVHRIEKAIGFRGADRTEIAERLRSAADRYAAFEGGEFRGADIGIGLRRAGAEAGLRGQIDHRADFFAEFRRHVAVDDLDALGDAGIDRIRERHAGLIGDRLPVDDVLALAVRALKVETAVLIFREAGRRRDDLLHRSRRDRGRRLRDVRLVDVDVTLAVVGLQLRDRRTRRDADRLAELCHGELDRRLDGHRGMDVD